MAKFRLPLGRECGYSCGSCAILHRMLCQYAPCAILCRMAGTRGVEVEMPPEIVTVAAEMISRGVSVRKVTNILADEYKFYASRETIRRRFAGMFLTPKHLAVPAAVMKAYETGAMADVAALRDIQKQYADMATLIGERVKMMIDACDEDWPKAVDAWRKVKDSERQCIEQRLAHIDIGKEEAARLSDKQLVERAPAAIQVLAESIRDDE